VTAHLAALWDGLGVDALAHPERLLWLLPAAVIALALALRARPGALPWPALTEARAAGARRRDGVRAVSLALRVGALAALACVLAEPVGVQRTAPEPGRGLDLVLALDASGSMRAADALVLGVPRSRLELARRVVTRFAATRAAAGDRVALVVFGESAFTACPLTGDGTLLTAALARVEAGIAGEATALGDALALAVKRALHGRRAPPRADPLAGRAVVLLTDGRNNAGSIPLDVAIALARSEGVRVHTVGIGATDADPPAGSASGADGRSDVRHDVDAATLARIASATGGRFFPVRRSHELDAVYREIDALERVTRIEPPRWRRTERPEPLLALAAGCLLAEIATERVLRRRLP